MENEAKGPGTPETVNVTVNVNAVDTLVALVLAVQMLTTKVDALVALPARITAVMTELNTHVASLKAAVDAQKPSAA